jgi:hypothetical protein
MTKADLDQHRITNLVVVIWKFDATGAHPKGPLSTLACGMNCCVGFIGRGGAFSAGDELSFKGAKQCPFTALI